MIKMTDDDYAVILEAEYVDVDQELMEKRVLPALLQGHYHVWLKIAGDYAKPVRVVNKDKQEVYRVPSLAPRTINNNSGRPLGDFLKEINRIRMHNPNEADHVLNLKMENMAPFDPEWVKGWQDTWNRLEGKPVQASAAPTVEKRSLKNDYEEL